MLLTVVPVILSIVFGVGIALLLNRHVFGRGFLRTLIISPFLVMSTAAALVWKFTILDTTFGVLNFFLRPFGVGQANWIGVHSQADDHHVPDLAVDAVHGAARARGPAEPGRRTSSRPPGSTARAVGGSSAR